MNDEQEQTVGFAANKGKCNLFILLLLGVVILVAGGVWYGVTSGQSSSTSRPGSIQYTPPTPPEPLTSFYKGLIQDQVAQEFHLTTAQLKAKVQANPDGIFGAAHDQGMSDDQLATIVIDAFQTASSKMVSIGKWTQQQSDTEMRYWKERDSKALAGDVTNWFVA